MRSWRTQVHFLELDPEAFDVWLVKLSYWHSDDIVRVSMYDLPDEVRAAARPDYRCHALVNLGAERVEELRFMGWEIH